MTDLQMRISSIIQNLAKDTSRATKVVTSLKAFSGLDITHFSNQQTKIINKYLARINSIIANYPIKTYDDYNVISSADLNKILKSVQALCFNLLADLKYN